MPAQIFISFASKDHNVAETICKAIEHRGFSCWISSRDIHPGENFQESIVHAIRTSKVMVLVFSDNANNSQEVKKEVALASRNNLLVIPIRVEDVIPNEAFDYELVTRQWIDVHDNWEEAIQRLIQKLTEALGPRHSSPSSGEEPLFPRAANGPGNVSDTPPNPAAHAAAMVTPFGRRSALVIAAVVIAILGGALAWQLWSKVNTPIAVLEPKPNPGVTRDGAQSGSYRQSKNTLEFDAGSQSPGTPATRPTAAPGTAAICPDNFVAYADTTDPIRCVCTADAIKRGSVWGMDTYTGDSSVCRAALHAGVVGQSGGPVTAIPEPGGNVYPGVTRNGVLSSNFGPYNSSFRFDAGSQSPGTPATRPTAAAPGTAAICPDNFVAYANTTDPIRCVCTADAIKGGSSVWGMDTYTGDSSVCRAALHAGVVGQSGGPVTAIPEPGRDAYPGVTRNGISSSNYGHYNSSFRFDAQAMPITLDDNPASKALLGKSAVGTH